MTIKINQSVDCRKIFSKKVKNKYQFPLVIERDEDGFYVVECPVFSGCYTQGKTMSEAIKNIKEVIDLCLEEESNQSILKDYKPQEIQYKTLNYA